MCRNRTARTPRIYYNEMGDIYTVNSTEDDDYDQDHREFISTFFATGNSIDDYYRLCDNWQDYRSHDIVECGLAEADLDHTITNRPSSLKSSPTTAVLQKHAARTGYMTNTFHTRFSDTTMMVPTPKSSSKGMDEVGIHHILEEDKPQHQCERCPAKFRKCNKLFQHLRTSQHHMSTDVKVFATPNNPEEEHDPDMVKSTALAVFRTGYSFQTYNYLEMTVRLDKHSPET
jgi:hypothetical protein